MGKSRQHEHQQLIDWLLNTVTQQEVEAVVIAGDIFDTGTPPSYARELYNQLVLRLHEAKVSLVVLAGNHDAPAVLGESQALLARLGTHVFPTASTPEAHVLTLTQRDGQPGCLLCALPFIRPRDVMESQAGQSAEDKQHALQGAIQTLYAQTFAEAERINAERLAEKKPRLPILATGHLTTVGASTSESVREIYVGSLESFPTNAFPPADYIALGHIHRPQTVGGQTHIRYSGSPLTLSFDEAGQTKEILLIDVDHEGLKTITPQAVPCFQPMQALRCTLDNLPAKIGKMAAQTGVSDSVWVELTIETDDYLPDLANRVQQICEGWPIEMLRIRRARETRTASIEREAFETLDELSPSEVFSRRLALETLDDNLRDALVSRYESIVKNLLFPTTEE